MCMSGSLHCKGEIDQLYVSRNKGGRVLNNVSDTFKTRMVKLSDHLEQVDEKNPLLSMVRNRERENIIRIGESIRQRYTSDDHHGTDYIKEQIKKEHFDLWQNKVTHRYLRKKILENEDVNVQTTNQWLKSNMSSHVEGYITATQEQELNTKDAMKRKEKNLEKKGRLDNTCRLCKKSTEISSCPEISSSLYLYIRHNAVAKVILEAVIQEKKTTE